MGPLGLVSIKSSHWVTLPKTKRKKVIETRILGTISVSDSKPVNQDCGTSLERVNLKVSKFISGFFWRNSIRKTPEHGRESLKTMRYYYIGPWPKTSSVEQLYHSLQHCCPAKTTVCSAESHVQTYCSFSFGAALTPSLTLLSKADETERVGTSESTGPPSTFISFELKKKKLIGDMVLLFLVQA